MPAWQRTALNIAAHSIPAMQFTGSDFGKVPSDNIAMLRRLSRDPKVIKWTRVDAIYGLSNLMDAAYDAAPALHGNILILFGDKEDILPEAAMRQFEMRLPKSECGIRLASYKSGFHMLLRDLKAETVMRDIAAWVEQIYRDNRSNPKGSFSTPFQFQWVVGARSEEEALAIARKFSLEGVCERVQCPFLTVHGEEDRVVAVDSAHKLHAALGTQRKTLKIFSRAEGAAEHVQVDDRQRGVDYIADWLADNL